MVSEQLISKFRSVTKTASDNSKQVSDLISLRDRTEQLEDSLNNQMVMERMEEHMPKMSYGKVHCDGWNT
jgi:hypothetical protein